MAYKKVLDAFFFSEYYNSQVNYGHITVVDIAINMSLEMISRLS